MQVQKRGLAVNLDFSGKSVGFVGYEFDTVNHVCVVFMMCCSAVLFRQMYDIFSSFRQRACIFCAGNEHEAFYPRRFVIYLGVKDSR